MSLPPILDYVSYKIFFSSGGWCRHLVNLHRRFVAGVSVSVCKIHLTCDGHDRSLCVIITPGKANDMLQAE